MTILSKIVTVFLCTMAYIELASPINRRPFRGSRLAALVLAFEHFLLVYVAVCITFSHYRWQSVLISASIAVLSDLAAFITGRILGEHKVKALRHISPNKSWEGYLGGFIIGFTFTFFCRLPVTFAITSIIASMLGDLASSLIKRSYDLKDFNDLVKTHPIIRILEFPVLRCGGYMDRMDSISFALLALIIRSYF